MCEVTRIVCIEPVTDFRTTAAITAGEGICAGVVQTANATAVATPAPSVNATVVASTTATTMSTTVAPYSGSTTVAAYTGGAAGPTALAIGGQAILAAAGMAIFAL